MSSPLLELRGLRRGFGARKVLEEADLALEAGARLTVAGVSGSGKTTLLRLIAGLDPPEAGEILLEGETASRPGRIVLPPWKRGVQMVFQNGALWPTRTVLAHLLDVQRAQGWRGDLAGNARAVLDRLGLGELAARRPATLSGGERRRLALGRALVLQPRLLLLDEPFASLDPVARESGLAFLEDVLAESRAAVILVTHEPSEARSLGGEVVFLAAGRLSAPRTCEEACASDAIFRRSLAD
ncbi:MAG: ATP-binding cassette domain-containing protein [Planctomycetota bacterium]